MYSTNFISTSCLSSKLGSFEDGILKSNLHLCAFATMCMNTGYLELAPVCCAFFIGFWFGSVSFRFVSFGLVRLFTLISCSGVSVVENFSGLSGRLRKKRKLQHEGVAWRWLACPAYNED